MEYKISNKFENYYSIWINIINIYKIIKKIYIKKIFVNYY